MSTVIEAVYLEVKLNEDGIVGKLRERRINWQCTNHSRGIEEKKVLNSELM